MERIRVEQDSIDGSAAAVREWALEAKALAQDTSEEEDATPPAPAFSVKSDEEEDQSRKERIEMISVPFVMDYVCHLMRDDEDYDADLVMSDMIAYAQDSPVMGFGVHRARTVGEVWGSHPNYLKFIATQPWCNKKNRAPFLQEWLDDRADLGERKFYSPPAKRKHKRRKVANHEE